MTNLQLALLFGGLGLLAWAVFAPGGAVAVLPVLPLPVGGDAACPAAGHSVVLIGDSLAVGMKGPMAKLAVACATTFSSSAEVGTSVTQWAKDQRLVPVLALHPTAVLVSLGANDFGRNDQANVFASINALVTKVRAAGARILWIEPLTMPFPDKLGVVPAWKASVGEDYYPGSQLDIPRAGDKIHPTPAGYATFAEKVWRWAAGRLR